MNQEPALKAPLNNFIPYATQAVEAEDIQAVIDVLKSSWLTQGPQVSNFEKAIAAYCGVDYATAVSSGTAALHIACRAAGLEKGDILWTSPNTFVASANCALYCGAEVDFVDIDRETKNISPDALAEKIKEAERKGKLPKILVAVHFAGHPCDMKPIYKLCHENGILVIEDAAHALGSRYQNIKVGACEFSDMTTFSFHAIKTIATGEGGVVVTRRKDLHSKLQRFRSHGITKEASEFQNNTNTDPWFYEQQELGFNYRLTDLQCALGLSQLNRLDDFVSKRRKLVARYNDLLKNLPLRLPIEKDYALSAWHLYAPEINPSQTKKTRRAAFDALKSANIGANVHYIPVHLQPYYQKLGFRKGDFPNAESHYENTFSLPLHTRLDEESQDLIAQCLGRFFSA